MMRRLSCFLIAVACGPLLALVALIGGELAWGKPVTRPVATIVTAADCHPCHMLKAAYDADPRHPIRRRIDAAYRVRFVDWRRLPLEAQKTIKYVPALQRAGRPVRYLQIENERQALPALQRALFGK